MHQNSQLDIALSAQARNVDVSSFVFALMAALAQGRTDGCSSAEAGRQTWGRESREDTDTVGRCAFTACAAEKLPQE